MKLSWILIVASVLALSGCGQKGPLFLPDSSTQTQSQ